MRPCEGCAVCVQWEVGVRVGVHKEVRACTRAPPRAEVLRGARARMRTCRSMRGFFAGASRFAAAAAAAGESVRVARSRLHRLDGCFCGRFVAPPLRPDDLHAGPTGKPKEPRHSPASCNQRVALLLLEVLKPLRAALLALSGLRGRRLLRLRPKLLPLLLPLVQLRRRRR